MWFLKYKVQQTEVLSFWRIPCTFSPLTIWKIKNLKLKKAPVDIIILQMCIINDSQSYDVPDIYGVQRTGFFVILDRFLPFYPSNKLKNHNFEKIKKFQEILSLYPWIPKITIIKCMVPEISSTIDRSFCHFGPFFALLPLNNLKSQTFEKMKKMLGDIIIFHKCFINGNHVMYGS